MTVSVLWHNLMMPWVQLQCLNVVLSDHTLLLFVNVKMVIIGLKCGLDLRIIINGNKILGWSISNKRKKSFI